MQAYSCPCQVLTSIDKRPALSRSRTFEARKAEKLELAREAASASEVTHDPQPARTTHCLETERCCRAFV